MTDSLISIYDYKNVSIIGRVNLNDKGHYNEYFASLDSVFCIKKL